MRYEYFGAWHRYYKGPVEPLTTKEAERRHSRGKGYCVAVRGGEDRYMSFIEVSADYYGVNFLDVQGRADLTYGFEDVGQQKLFLKQAIFVEFAEQGDQPLKVTTYYFKETGEVTIERTSPGTRSGEVTEGRHDVSGNWEVRPSFGDFGLLLRRERPRSAATA